ncbi:MAG: hypothetical protein HQK53_16660 [Oligoflexia bacterium]|nr:hypothetical protein [Oligoflexia bacterium]
MNSKSTGQAVVEYVLILAIMAFISVKAAGSVRKTMNNAFGQFSKVLSIHLTVGVCKDSCFFSGYINGGEN